MQSSIALHGLALRHSVVLDTREHGGGSRFAARQRPGADRRLAISPTACTNSSGGTGTLVEPAKLAKLLGASVRGRRRDGRIDGLAAGRGDSARDEVARLHHHHPPQLAPPALRQLLELLEMTPEQLAFALREDDVLVDQARHVEAQVRAVALRVRRTRRRGVARRRSSGWSTRSSARRCDRPAEPRFRLLAAVLPEPAAARRAAVPPVDSERQSLRFIYSYFAVYGDPLLNPELDPYPDGLLQRLSALGINGVWLHVVLRDLAPGGAAFPEFGDGHEQRLANLRALVERAKKYGIGVYLYMNEPRAMPEAFFRESPRNGRRARRRLRLTALCTSHPAVRQWMGDALTYVFREVPDLAGVFTITASENLTNCASHGHWRSARTARIAPTRTSSPRSTP